MNPATPPAAGEQQRLRTTRPLCVDLDGTLISTDLFCESCVNLIAREPWKVVLLPVWFFRGRAYLKRRLAEQAAVNIATLPYHEDVIRSLQKEKAAGREILLVTAADGKLAEELARHLGLFSKVLASDGRVNVKGRQKLETIRQHLGNQGFDYIGDSAADLPVVAAAAGAALVRPSARLLGRANKVARIEQTFGVRSSRAASIWKALRIHQWAKNALVWVPLLLAHKASDVVRLRWGLVAFLSFSLVASGLYVINDLLDLEADRQHPRKRERPFAAGALPLWMAAILVPLLLAGGFGLTAVLPSREFAAALGIYLLLGITYCLLVRRVVVLDVLLLAGLYALRVLAGGLAMQVVVTPWLLAFSMFLFLSLAFLKRYAELHLTPTGEAKLANGRDYQGGDQDLLRSMGTASGYLSVLVLALYVNSHEVISLYRRPQFLWGVCALMLYWITHMWFTAHRGKVNEDPLIFTLKDPVSYAVGAGIALAILAAI